MPDTVPDGPPTPEPGGVLTVLGWLIGLVGTLGGVVLLLQAGSVGDQRQMAVGVASVLGSAITGALVVGAGTALKLLAAIRDRLPDR